MKKQSRHDKLLERYRKILSQRPMHTDQPLRAFCRSHKISVWSYYYWKKKIPCDRATVEPKNEVQPFVPITLALEESPSSTYEIHFGQSTRLTVRSGFDREEAAALIDMLRARAS